MLKQFSIILSIFFLGELIRKVSGLPIPGNVVGMVVLFFGLYSGVIKLDMIGKISDFFLENLAFFFLPAAVSLITCFALLEGKWTAILVVSIISTIVTLAVTGLTVELVKRSIGRKTVEKVCNLENKDGTGSNGNKSSKSSERNKSGKGNKNSSGKNIERMHICGNGAEEVS